MVGALLLSACTAVAVRDAIERSTTDVLIPGGEWREAFQFTAPPGSTDLFELRWNFRAGATDVVTGWQVTSTSEYDEARFAEGPSTDLVNEAIRAAAGENCTEVDPDASLQLCTFPSEFARGGVNAYLVRLLLDQILVIGYNNLSGDRTSYNPDALESRFINADFFLTDLSEAEEYLVSVF